MKNKGKGKEMYIHYTYIYAFSCIVLIGVHLIFTWGGVSKDLDQSVSSVLTNTIYGIITFCWNIRSLKKKIKGATVSHTSCTNIVYTYGSNHPGAESHYRKFKYLHRRCWLCTILKNRITIRIKLYSNSFVPPFIDATG